jgi:hypothetical protein
MNKFIKLLFVTAFVVSIGSCLKDKNYDNHITGHNLDGASKVIELGIINSPAHDLSVAVDFKDASITVTFLTVRLAANEVAPEDITVTIDTTGTNGKLSAYNTATGKSIVRLPNSFYTFDGGLSVVIPKGAREGYLKIKTNAFAFDPSTTYGLAFKIGSINKTGYIASQNFGEYITTIGAKNKYDGNYSLSGYHNRVPYNFRYVEQSMDMITTGASTVAFYYNDAGDFGHPIGVGVGQTSWYGNTMAPQITFDPVTDVVTSVTNGYTAAGAAVVTLFTGAGSFPSRMDPATKTIYVCWNYNGNPLRAFFDTLTYVGPR